ncbi:hypothetical protein SRHO_G00254960 [Serrasalmus rhombeus]
MASSSSLCPRTAAWCGTFVLQLVVRGRLERDDRGHSFPVLDGRPANEVSRWKESDAKWRKRNGSTVRSYHVNNVTLSGNWVWILASGSSFHAERFLVVGLR